MADTYHRKSPHSSYQYYTLTTLTTPLQEFGYRNYSEKTPEHDMEQLCFKCARFLQTTKGGCIDFMFLAPTPLTRPLDPLLNSELE